MNAPGADVQGSRYHLIHGAGDWGSCVEAGSGLPLQAVWAEIASGSPPGAQCPLEYDPDLGVLRLTRQTPLFHRAGHTDPLDIGTRRGAARDSYGNWFWIGEDRRSIMWRPDGESAGSPAPVWWTPDAEAWACAVGATFRSCTAPPPPDLVLQGLTVTTGHYLLAGYLGGDGVSWPAESGLFVFDLQAGGDPLRMIWPAGFVPSDLADTPDGGALVLDAASSVCYRLDDRLRLRGTQPAVKALFQPVSGPLLVFTQAAEPTGSPVPANAVSVEPGPDGSVLILESDPARGYSVLHRLDGDTLTWSSPLLDVLEVIDPADPDATPQQYSVFGHDMAFEQAGGPLAAPMLYIADVQGKQVLAFTLDASTGHLLARPDFLPLRRWAGRALVRAGGGVWYDFGDRWIPVEVFTECRFQTSATITTALDAGIAGASFDSQQPGCVWHRLFLDAQVPVGTAVSIRARASDDPDLVGVTPWNAQPASYQRTGGPELPWWDPWADVLAADGVLPDRTGTFELLFQQVTGRYLQLEITLSGGGRSSPLLRSLRAWYPRYSYVDHHLPAVYAAGDSGGAFLTRFLANFEGFYTAIEEKIEHSHLLVDARTTPAPDLPWLASWFALLLEPQWDEARRRFLVRNVDRFYRWRGTVAGLVAMLRAYLQPAVDDTIFCSPSSGAGGVRVVESFLTRDIAVSESGELTAARGAAHRFDVLIPVGLSDDTLTMIEKIVQAGKPAHTGYLVRRYYELFIVGQARLGLDTQLGDGPRFIPMVTGRDYLAAGFLGYPRPYDITDRIVLDRDRVGAIPEL
jgi:phage tail-like protein